VEDGPTITHGGMAWGSGLQAVRTLDVTIVDPRLSAVPEIRAVYDRFPHIGLVLPAMGYNPQQRDALRKTIDDSDADVVVVGTPIDFARDVGISKPVVRVRYDFQDHGKPKLMNLIDEFLEGRH
jgi:predicted GTPase